MDEYYVKRGNRHDDISDKHNVLIEFEPKWARFTDYSQGHLRLFLKL